jgi:hypothetical protein
VEVDKIASRIVETTCMIMENISKIFRPVNIIQGNKRIAHQHGQVGGNTVERVNRRWWQPGISDN